MSFDDETQKIITDEMNKLRENKKLIPFIGAGFSANLKDFPTWEKFIDIIQRLISQKTGNVIDLKSVFNENWMEATEYFYWVMGEQELISKGIEKGDPIKEGKEIFRTTLVSEFNSINKTEVSDDEEWEQHILLIEKFEKMYTTNWDISLECVALQKGHICEKYTCGINDDKCTPKVTETTNSDRRVIEICKFHGCYEEGVNTIVASESDYYKRLKELGNHPLDKKLQYDLANNCFVFIGYDLRDVNVNYFFNQVRQLGFADRKNIYVVKLADRKNINIHKINFYKHKKITLVPILTEDDSRRVAGCCNEEEKQVIYKRKIIEFLKTI